MTSFFFTIKEKISKLTIKNKIISLLNLFLLKIFSTLIMELHIYQYPIIFSAKLYILL